LLVNFYLALDRKCTVKENFSELKLLKEVKQQC